MTASITTLKTPLNAQLKEVGKLAKHIAINILIGVVIAVPVALISGAIIAAVQNNPETAE